MQEIKDSQKKSQAGLKSRRNIGKTESQDRSWW
jgi:hypothetical protein